MAGFVEANSWPTINSLKNIHLNQFPTLNFVQFCLKKKNMKITHEELFVYWKGFKDGACGGGGVNL